MVEKEHMTLKGLEKLKERLSFLEKQLSDLRVYKNEEAVYAGDAWHDNQTLFQVEARERGLMGEVAELKRRMANAGIIRVPKESERAELGSSVCVRFSDGSTGTFLILGEADSDLSENIISYRSPLGRALMGKKAGERIAYSAGNGGGEVEILSISPGSF